MRAMPEKMLLMLAFFFKNPLSVKNAFLMPAQLPDAYITVGGYRPVPGR